jgi:hypothetical protein
MAKAVRQVTANQIASDASLDDPFKHTAENISLAEAFAPGARKYRMIRNRILDTEPAEPEISQVCRLVTNTRRLRSSETAGQLHELADAGGIEIVDLRGEPDDTFDSRRLEPCRQTVADLDEMLRFADRRAPLAARAIAARFQDASAVELDPQQHMHVLEAARNCGVEVNLKLGE